MNIEKFKESDLSIALVKNEKIIFTSKEHMLIPLLDAIKKFDLSEIVVYDKIVGRGAALLLIYAKVKEVYGVVVSKPALEILNSHQIPITAEKTQENIMNKAGDDLCPMEKMALDFSDPEEFYSSLTRGATMKESETLFPKKSIFTG